MRVARWQQFLCNSLTMVARLSGLDAWDKDVRRYVQSNLIPAFNPVSHFLSQARRSWDGQTDHIGRPAAASHENGYAVLGGAVAMMSPISPLLPPPNMLIIRHVVDGGNSGINSVVSLI